MQSLFLAGFSWQYWLESSQHFPNLCTGHDILLRHQLVSCQKCIQFLWILCSCFVLRIPCWCFVLWTPCSRSFPVPILIAMSVDLNFEMHKIPVHIFKKNYSSNRQTYQCWTSALLWNRFLFLAGWFAAVTVFGFISLNQLVARQMSQWFPCVLIGWIIFPFDIIKSLNQWNTLRYQHFDLISKKFQSNRISEQEFYWHFAVTHHCIILTRSFFIFFPSIDSTSYSPSQDNSELELGSIVESLSN